MFNVFKPSPSDLFRKSLTQHRQLVNQIEQLNTTPFSYTNFCIKRQIELELLDLSIILANTVSYVSATDRQAISDAKNWPITLDNQKVKPINSLAHSLIPSKALLADLASINRALVLPENRQHISNYQKTLYDTHFPQFAKLPFMSTEVFWRILNHTYKNPKEWYFKVPTFYYHHNHLSLTDTESFYSNQGDLYDYYAY